jgi:hypothetical protein
MSRGERSMVGDATPSSYYGRPVLKEPVWKWPIAGYFFTGGVAAGSSLLAAGSAIVGNTSLARQSRLVSLAAVAASGALLIEDLGQPKRFLHMLRVFKPTSPMSMGTWLLTIFGPAAGVAATTDALGTLPRIRVAADTVAALAAPALATYTAVLVADTAVPVWHEARRELPFLFAAGAAAGAGGIATALQPPGHAAPSRRMAIAGGLAELATARWMESSLGPLAEPYHEGRAGRLRQIGTAVTAAGVALLVLAGRRRAGAVVGGSLVAAGAAVERYTVVDAGRQSARDPKYTVAPQRARLEAEGKGEG